MAFVFLLEPFKIGESPAGLPAGVYRFSSSAHKVSPVVIPGATRAPGGGMFAGASFGASLNDRGDLVFAGIVPTNQGGVPFPGHPGLGQGLFRARGKGAIASVVSPGDAAPGGRTFDFAAAPWTNNRGDVAFQGHVAGEEILPPPDSEGNIPGFPPPEIAVSCLGSVYVKDGATGKIRSIAHAGDKAPGGGVFRQATSPVAERLGRHCLPRRPHASARRQ